MADRQKGYGLSRELGDKIDSKYDIEEEAKIVAWMTRILGESPSGPGREAVHAWLKDGQILCKLMNAIQPGSCPKVHDPSKTKMLAMRKNKEMENISVFLNAITKYGVGISDLFQTVDLYENQNMAQVLATLNSLGSMALKKGYTGPKLGVKIANENRREFDEQKLREGRNIIGLQMGTNQVASQGGMTPYGLGRQLTPQNN